MRITQLPSRRPTDAETAQHDRVAAAEKAWKDATRVMRATEYHSPEFWAAKAVEAEAFDAMLAAERS